MVDPSALRRLVPEHLIPDHELGRRAAMRAARPNALVRAPLHDSDAEDLRAWVASGDHAHACGLLRNRAVVLSPVRNTEPTS